MMECKASSAIYSLAFVVVLTCAWKLVNWLWLRPKKLERCLRDLGFKVNPYKFLYGDTKEYISMIEETQSKPMDTSSNDVMPRIQPYQRHYLDLHGKTFCMWFGPRPTLVLADPKLIREVLFNYEGFQKVERTPYIKLILTGILGTEGKEWAMHRNLLNPAFSLEKLKMIRKWDALFSPSGSCEIDIWPFLTNFTADVISRTAFGSNYEEGDKIFRLQKEQSCLVLQGVQSFYIPGWRFLPTKTNRRFWNIQNEMEAILKDIISNKEKAMKTGGGADDLLAILLKTNSEAPQEPRKKTKIKMTAEDVIEECKTFYTAGHETTSGLLVWTLFLLSKHQKWQDLAREEVLRLLGDREPDSNVLNQLKTVTMILHEVLRLYPSVILTGRGTREKIRLGEVVLPSGVDIEVSFISILHDPSIWGDDVNQFNPERFSEGIAKASKVPGAFFAFSAGPRICLGQNFALLEAKIALVMILRRFSFKLSPCYQHAPKFVLTIEPEYGMPLILQKI